MKYWFMFCIMIILNIFLLIFIQYFIKRFSWYGFDSSFSEDAPHFVRQSSIWYLFSIQLILVISFLLIVSLNNAIGLIEYTESYNW